MLRDATKSELAATLPRESRILKPVDLAEFLKMTLPPREYVLSPWLPVQGLAMVYALRGLGKTHFALECAYAIASGGNFLKWKAPRPRGVLFIDGEMPARTMQERLARIVSVADSQPQRALRLLTPDFQPNGMLDLTNREDQEALERHLEGIDLIIVDSISTLCRSGIENEAESWLPVQEWALRQRSAGRSVLFIHHAGKGGAQRGTSRREDVLDTVIGLQQPKSYNRKRNVNRTLSVELC